MRLSCSCWSTNLCHFYQLQSQFGFSISATKRTPWHRVVSLQNTYTHMHIHAVDCSPFGNLNSELKCENMLEQRERAILDESLVPWTVFCVCSTAFLMTPVFLSSSSSMCGFFTFPHFFVRKILLCLVCLLCLHSGKPPVPVDV